MTTTQLAAIGVLAIANVLLFIALFNSMKVTAGYYRELTDSNVRAEQFAAKFREVDKREASFRHALGFYGDEETWVAPGRSHSAAFKDRGRIARDTLRSSR